MSEPNETSKGFLTGMALKPGEPKEKSRIESFKEAAAPLVEWLKENCDPHTTAIVNDAYAELKTGELGVPFDENYIQYERLNFQIEKRDVK